MSKPCFQHNAGRMAVRKCNERVGCIPSTDILGELIRTADQKIA